MKKTKIGLYLGIALVYGLLACAFLVSYTAAKFTDGRTVYTDFRAAQFNAAILLGAGETGQALHQVDLTSLRPGLVGENALRIPFRVSNGPDEQTTAKVGLKYTVRVCTPRNLPLQFSLETQVTENGAVKTVTYPQNSFLELMEKEPESLEQDWYQTKFQAAPETQVPEVTNLPMTASEAEFLLVPETIGDFVQNQHWLVIQWPVDDADLQYMKEVEPIRILVTAHSINRLEDETYVPEDLPEMSAEDMYTTGVVLLRDGFPVNTYTLDLRAFRPEGEGQPRSFAFWVDNGIGHNLTQSSDRLDYSIGMKLPLELVGETEPVWQELQLSFLLDGQNAFALSHYEICNEKTGEIRTEENGAVKRFTWEALSQAELLSEERPYAVYTGTGGTLRNYEFDDTAQKVPAANRNLHTLTVSGEDVERITTVAQGESFSFYNKAELLIATVFASDTPGQDTPAESTLADAVPGQNTPEQPPAE